MCSCALPSSAQDSATIDRMRDYVALLAPRPGAAEETGHLPWQSELLRQQQALAKVLQLCPTNAPDTVRRTLAQFMRHSQERLRERLDKVQWRVGAADDAGQDQQQRSPTSRARTSAALSPGPHNPLSSAQTKSTAPSAEAFLEQLRSQRRAVCRLHTC